MEYEVVRAGGLDLVGLEVRASNDDPSPIGELWQRVYGDPFFQGAPELVAVYCEYEGDHTKPYTFFLGRAGADAPEGYVRRTVPEGEFARFQAEGEMPAALMTAWGAIWTAPIERRFDADYELHPAAQPSWVAIYVGI